MVRVGVVVECLSAAKRRCLDRPRRRRRRRPILSRTRARILSDLKRAYYGVRAITGRSRRSARSFVGLPYASSEMRPNLFAFYRAGGMILARAHMATFRTIERALARAPVVARCCVLLQVARARTAKAKRAHPLSKREKGSRGESVARDEVWIARSRPRVRVHEAYLACVFIF